uniref:Uncharacterized protein n=1 Tax=Oryza barthii TaxID=65489 RepID=A0A0D3GG25_9ORYZ
MVLEPVHQHSKGLPRRQLACGPPCLSFAFWIDSFVSSLSRPLLVLASSLLSHGVRGPLRPRLFLASFLSISVLVSGSVHCSPCF